MGSHHLESAKASKRECQQEWNVAIRNMQQAIVIYRSKIAINPTKERKLRARCQFLGRHPGLPSELLKELECHLSPGP